MIYKEWCEIIACCKIRGNACFDFKRLDDGMCELKVSPIGKEYVYVELQKLELQNWFNAHVVLPDYFAFFIYDCL